MINPLQTTIPVGVPTALQDQANAVQVRGDVRTHNAEQVNPRNVENSTAGAGLTTAEQKPKNPPSAQTKDAPKEEKKKAPEGYLPPPPTRFQEMITEKQEKLIQSQKAVGEYILMAAIGGGMAIPENGESQVQASAEAETKAGSASKEASRRVDVNI